MISQIRKNNRGEWDALENALNTGDFFIFPPELGKQFTEEYKQYYPKF